MQSTRHHINTNIQVQVRIESMGPKQRMRVSHANDVYICWTSVKYPPLNHANFNIRKPTLVAHKAIRQSD